MTFLRGRRFRARSRVLLARLSLIRHLCKCERMDNSIGSLELPNHPLGDFVWSHSGTASRLQLWPVNRLLSEQQSVRKIGGLGRETGLALLDFLGLYPPLRGYFSLFV